MNKMRKILINWSLSRKTSPKNWFHDNVTLTSPGRAPLLTFNTDGMVEEIALNTECIIHKLWDWLAVIPNLGTKQAQE